MLEAVVVAGLGGFVGSAVGTVASLLVGLVASRVAPAWESHVSWMAALLAATMAGGTGVVFGRRPAVKAARLDVVDCLRGERA
jgi:putative ABC transport system permease protein